MIKILDGKLWQWGTGRLVQVVPPAGVTVTEVHFCNGTSDTTLRGVLQAQDDGSVLVKIPDILLQIANPLSVYAVKSDPTGECTTERELFVVWPQTKPADYEYVEPDAPAFGEEYEGRLLYVSGGALVPLFLGPGLEIRNGTLYITGGGGGGGDVETGITVEADNSGVLRVYSGGEEILPTVDENGVIIWPGVAVSVDASGTLIFEEV